MPPKSAANRRESGKSTPGSSGKKAGKGVAQKVAKQSNATPSKGRPRQSGAGRVVRKYFYSHGASCVQEAKPMRQ